MARPDIPRQ
jgi:uncharacterized OsmC-like protein